MGTRGIRNNNPLNIRHGKSQWVGMRKVQTDKAFVQFTERVFGYRAAFILLRNYIGSGRNTIEKIISRWAPPSDGNNTWSYIEHVSITTGIGARRPLRWEDKNELVNIVRSMAQIESGIIESREYISKAYDIASGQKLGS